MRIRNFIAICFAWLLILTAIITCTSYILSYLTYGIQGIYPTILQDFSFGYKLLIVAINHCINTYTQQGFSAFFNMNTYHAHNYLVDELFISITISSIVSFIILRSKYKRINNWDPFALPENLYGNAHWATEKEIRAAGLLKKQGAILGRFKRKFLVYDGYEHVLFYAPTGSGKGVGLVIPNLLFCQDSMIIHDIKGENYEITSGYRKNVLGQEVYILNFASFTSSKYNPLDFISTDRAKMVDDVQKISSIIIPEQDFWNNEGRALLNAILLCFCTVKDRPITFSNVLKFIQSDNFVYQLSVIMDEAGGIMHNIAYMNFASYLQKAESEQGSVKSTLLSKLNNIFNISQVKAATSGSDFSFYNMKKKKTTVYIIAPPSDMQKIAPLMQIIYQQACGILTEKMPDKKEDPHGVTMLVDEFPTLGKMMLFKEGIAYFRGYRVRLILIAQDTEQLKKTYEEAGMNTFISNSKYRGTYSANTISTAEYVSKTIGYTSIKDLSKNAPKFLDFNPFSRTVSESEVQRALILPDEVMQLDPEKEILLVEGQPAIFADKIRYYLEKFFKNRLYPKVDFSPQQPIDQDKKLDVDLARDKQKNLEQHDDSKNE